MAHVVAWISLIICDLIIYCSIIWNVSDMRSGKGVKQLQYQLFNGALFLLLSFQYTYAQGNVGKRLIYYAPTT